MFTVVILVIFLRRVKTIQHFQLRHDWTLKRSGCLQEGNNLFNRFFLFQRGVKHYGAVLRAEIKPLRAAVRWVVEGKKEFEELL